MSTFRIKLMVQDTRLGQMIAPLSYTTMLTALSRASSGSTGDPIDAPEPSSPSSSLHVLSFATGLLVPNYVYKTSVTCLHLQKHNISFQQYKINGKFELAYAINVTV